MKHDRLIAQLINDEGLKRFAYQDHLGYLTIGVGRCIDERKGKGISRHEALYLLSGESNPDNDIDGWFRGLQKILPWINSLDDLRQEVLVCMSHQLGIDGLLKFKNFLFHLHTGNYKQASDEGLNSLWAQQTPDRAKRMMEMIRKGEK